MSRDPGGDPPACTLCAASSHGAVHVVSEPNGHGLLLHLTFSWVCDRCGHAFTDRRLEAMNGPSSREEVQERLTSRAACGTRVRGPDNAR